MDSQLLLSPTTNTAVADLTNRLASIKKQAILTPISILLPTDSIIHDLRSLLGDTIGVQFYQFYRLGNAILGEAGIPIHLINDTAIRRLIRQILRDMNAEGLLTTFAPVWQKPGFVEVLLDWIREMKSQGIFPQAYAEIAAEGQSERDQQLAEIYLRYQGFMQTRAYSDPDGLLWVAEEALQERPTLFQRQGPLFVLGFDQYTPVQLRILRQLADRFSELHIYLRWDEHRSEQSLALTRLRRARDDLLENIPLGVRVLPEAGTRHPGLAHLRQNLFESNQPEPKGKSAIQSIEAPSREVEVRRTLQEIKRLLLQGVSAADIAILAPNKNAYLPIIRTVSTEYGVPVECERPLMSNPAVLAFVNLLKLPPSFSWHETFEALRSPYVRQSWLSDEQIALLDQLSRERPVIAERDQWEFAVQALQMDAQELEDEDLGPPPLSATLEPDVLSAIEDGLTAFFDHLSPSTRATYWDYTWWLQTAIIGHFPKPEEGEDQTAEPAPTIDLMGACQQSPFSQRDLEALKLVMQALRRLLASAEIVPAETEVSWDQYRDELIALLNLMQIPPDPLQAGVRFEQLEAGRARMVDTLFVLGLSEGEFPTPPPADTLYTPAERENHPLPLIRYSPANEASLWWQVISNVNQKIILLRPYIDENGAPWQASPYWDAVAACFTDTQLDRIPIAEHPTPENTASQNELLVALAQAAARIIPEPLKAQWSYIQDAENILNQRLSFLPPGEYEGIIRNDALKAELNEWFGYQHVWSASRLNRYANCPYGFFAEHILKLKANPDPQEGIDAMQRGSLLHAILELLYRQLAENQITPNPENQETILHHLDESCEALFPSAARRYGFRPSTLWDYEKHELHRLLRALVIWECQQNAHQARFSPYMQEAGFGIGRNGPPPLTIEGDSAQFKLRGLIDRIDRDPAGNLRVIDYKSGSTTYSKTDLQKGLALQTALYALAAERFWTAEGSRVAESHYWHIPIRNASGSLQISGAVLDDEIADDAIQQAARSVAQVRAGLFPSAPGKPVQGSLHCRGRCDFAAICRVTRHSITKAKRGGMA